MRTDPDPEAPEIPATAAWAGGQALRRYMVGRNRECVPRGANRDSKDGWVGAIDGAAEDAMPAVLAAALPHLLTDEMVERAADVIEDECGYGLASHLGIEPPHSPHWKFHKAPYWKRIARLALEAALGSTA